MNETTDCQAARPKPPERVYAYLLSDFDGDSWNLAHTLERATHFHEPGQPVEVLEYVLSRKLVVHKKVEIIDEH